MRQVKKRSPDPKLRVGGPARGSKSKGAAAPRVENSADLVDLARYAIGTRLRHARLTRGLRMKDVADSAGCSESLVSKIENNKLEPSLQVLHKLCVVLNISIGE